MSESEQEEQPEQIADRLVKQYGPRAVVRASAVGYSHAVTGELDLARKWLTVAQSAQEILAADDSGPNWMRNPELVQRGDRHNQLSRHTPGMSPAS